jgi:hypothetical protein
VQRVVNVLTISSSARATVALSAVATHRISAVRRDRQRGWAVEALTIVLRGTTELAKKWGVSFAGAAGAACEASVCALVRRERTHGEARGKRGAGS